ncbi:UPF0182 family protein [Pseudogemmatithrix spongiicola]|uniref:UPF0182 protein Strain138_000305 n=1 Tax=Pseudogemmatithrix spongiicola TaxID=3062599 RepID=A0AA49Q4A9_9BACT|nr:UPF0182 family protein [Gemmatimonadaceae bacterium 'strain 138']WKW13980.1 UPF0182 family protein [Gemmatimonadaceae bacterium 'strain 318']
MATINTAQRRSSILIIGVLLLLLGIPAIATVYTDWLWFQEIGFERVFTLRITAQLVLGGIALLLGFGLLYGNARLALRGMERSAESIRVLAAGGVEMRVKFLVAAAHRLALPATAFFALLLGSGLASRWRTLIQFWYRTPFGDVDPIFQRDISYYVFTLPAVQVALDWIWGVVFVSLLFVSLPIYLVRGDVGVRLGRLSIAPQAEWHLAALGALWLVLSALRTWVVGMPNLLFGTHGPLQGASYTDLYVRMPGLKLLAVLLLLGAVALLWGARRGNLARVAVVVVVGNFLLTALVNGVVPGVVQRLVVQPNELAKETPQIAHHIAATRRAWGLDAVERRELDGDQQLTARDIAANRSTIDNVRLWDREPLLQTFGQIQSIRTYYDFVAVDDDRYIVDGQMRHVLLSARELDPASLPTRTFVNEHLTFTHGMGLTLGPSNEFTAQGLPVLWMQDLPPTSTITQQVGRPQIYFGELDRTWVLAPSRQREFDFPSAEGDEAEYSTYAGRAGVPLSSYGRKLAFALRFGSMNILLSSDLTDSTRILFNQQVRKRAQLALPFLAFDNDPYLVVTDSGRLVWMLDAYTATDRYPYSARTSDGLNYLRNSVKVAVDAYDGDIRAWLVDPADPMINTLSKIYPDLLRPLAGMPADLRAHMRYPEDLFRAQTGLYATFHMTDPETFYHREDQWQIPAAQQGAVRSGYARHIVMRLPGERDTEYLMMRPFTPRQKDNLAAWMVARNDGEHYGKLISYRFPRQSLVFGPTQIANRINQDTEVSRQVSLWDQGGSEVIRGELLVIPIEASLLYVQPLYLRAQGGKIPELKRVIVAHNDRVVMEETLEGGLSVLFGDGTGLARASSRASSHAADATAGGAARGSDTAARPLDAERAALIQQAVQLYERARNAQRNDDWATYGDAMKRLGEVLQRLRQ